MADGGVVSGVGIDVVSDGGVVSGVDIDVGCIHPESNTATNTKVTSIHGRYRDCNGDLFTIKPDTPFKKKVLFYACDGNLKLIKAIKKTLINRWIIKAGQ